MSGTQSAVKYSKDFEVPADFPEILRNLTREILRENPTNIDKFGMYPIAVSSRYTAIFTLFPFQYLRIRLFHQSIYIIILFNSTRLFCEAISVEKW